MEFQEMAVIDEHAVCEGPARKESGKRGRKPGRKSADKVDMRAKLERSRQSARECRARKKLRYQYLEELVVDREKAVFALRKEIEQYCEWAKQIDAGHIPEGIHEALEDVIKQEQLQQQQQRGPASNIAAPTPSCTPSTTPAPK